MIRSNIPFLLSALLLLSVSACSDKSPAKPNIVLIIADDMAWDDCGAYGHPLIRTPNIDRLASEGMRFGNAFLTCSSCSPSRASIITGKYPHNTGAEQLHWPIPDGQVTFVELLRESGYWTAAAGKWHMGEAMKDRFDAVLEPGMEGFILPGSAEGEPGSMISANKSGCEDWLPVFRQRPAGKPFFLWLASFDPHRDYEDGIVAVPHTLNEVLVPPHLPDNPEVRKDMALYYDEISRLDSYVGMLLEELEQKGLSDHTFILFMSDNGRPFPRDKTTLYDGGIKTPFIIRWPGKVPPASQCDQLVSSVDIAPTLLDIAGMVSQPDMEGIPFTGLLRHPGIPVREFAYAEDHWHDYEDLSRAVRSLDYKYIRNDYNDLPATPSADIVRSLTFRSMDRLHASDSLAPSQTACFICPRPEEELYDIRADPFELHNLARDSAYQEVLAEFRRVLDEWTDQTNFRFPAARTPDEFDRVTGLPTQARIRPRPDRKWFVEKYGIE